MSLTSKLTITYKGPDKEEAQEFDTAHDRLAIMALTPGVPPSVLAQINLVKGAGYRIAIEMENEVTDMEEQDGVWCEVEK